MGRDTSGVRGMNVSQKGNAVLAMDVARDDQELLVVTENGYGKRTPIADYPVKGRGTMGVRTIKLTENKGGWPARWSFASTRSSCSSPRTGWSSAPRCAGSTARARVPGRPADEHP